MDHISTLLWEEKYRPQTFDDLILPNRVDEKIRKGAYTHFLLHGPPGSGKTSAAKVLAKEHDSIYINCSNETGVDSVRNKITDFASSYSLMGGADKLKIIILDELDGVSDAYFKALRGTIEQFHMTTRFIATCNYFNKIPDNVQSRFECINFDFNEDEIKEVEKSYMRRVHKICSVEGLTIQNDALVELVRRKFPDLRSTIKTLHGYKMEGTTSITKDTVVKFHGAHKDVYQLIFSKKAPKDFYKELGKYSSKTDEVIGSLGTEFIEFIQAEYPAATSKLPLIAYEVNQHSYQSRFVIDPYVCLLSLIFKLNSIINT